MRTLVEIHYAYPTSDRARKLGDIKRGGYYVQVGTGTFRSPLFQTIEGAEGFCRNNGLPVPARTNIPGATVVARA